MMTVNELREALEKMPGHWPVHVAVRADGSGGGADEDFLYTLEFHSLLAFARAVERAHGIGA